MNNLNIESFMEQYRTDLYEYNCSKKLVGGIMIHFSPIGSTDYFVGTVTSYDSRGLKSDKAVPFNLYIKLINEIESLLEPYKNTGFTGRVVGWNPTSNLKKFLYEKKVHRLFFLEESDVIKFVKMFTRNDRVEKRKRSIGVDVVIMFG